MPVSTPTPTAFLDSAEISTTGVAGAISGRQYDAIDLQYIGNGVFMVRSSAGAFDVQW